MQNGYVKFTNATYATTRGLGDAEIKELYLNPDEIESIAVGHNAAMVTTISGRMYAVSNAEAKHYAEAKARR
jgi:hypothetical protein